MAFTNNVRNIFTMLTYGMPNLLRPVRKAVEQVHKIRVLKGIVAPRDNDLCKQAVHDPLYTVF
jgi:hypothetical protein